MSRVLLPAQPWYQLALSGTDFRTSADTAATVYDFETGGPSTQVRSLGLTSYDWIDAGAFRFELAGSTINVVAGAGSGGGGGGGSVEGLTVDTGEEYRIIMLSDGTVRAIPVDAIPPGVPIHLAVFPKLTSVLVVWDPPAVGPLHHYRLLRDGVVIASPTDRQYRDAAILAGATYSYRVQAVDQYGQIGPPCDAVSAFIDPSLNVTPSDVEVRWYPDELPVGGRALVRVNATDLDTQQLTLTLGVDSGALTPTNDPSTWLYAL